MTAAERLDFLSSLTDAEAAALYFDWDFWARESQRLPEWGWSTWLILAGRGWGKSRTGAESVRRRVEQGVWRRIALVSDTVADVRDVMVEGESGILEVSAPNCRPTYIPARRQLKWPNGAIATCYSAEAPELLRGPQHDGAWVDELAKWKNLKVRDREGGTAWDNLLMGLRQGENPQAIVSTTPRPLPLIRELIKRETTHVTRGTSYENRANLSEKWFKEVILPYEGTRLGRQEIEAVLLDDNENALWNRKTIDAGRVQSAPDLDRVVVAIDPATTDKDSSNAAGISVVGVDFRAEPHAYVLADRTLKGSPREWAVAAVTAFREFKADRIIAETNNGGDMVELTLRTVDRAIPYRSVTASRGKRTRAEPVAAFYERGMIHHVGAFPELEDELCGWEPGEASPDRLDAMVWAVTDLLLSKNREAFGY